MILIKNPTVSAPGDVSLLDSTKENKHNYQHGKEINMYLKIVFIDLMTHQYIYHILINNFE